MSRVDGLGGHTFPAGTSGGRTASDKPELMQSDVADSAVRMRDQLSQENASSIGSSAVGAETGQTGGRHKELVQGLRMMTPGAGGQQAMGHRVAAAGAGATGASHPAPAAPKAGVVPQNFTAPASAQRRDPPSIIVPPRPVGQTPSTSTTPRGAGASNGSTPSSLTGSGAPPSTAPWNTGTGGTGGASTVILAKPTAATGGAAGPSGKAGSGGGTQATAGMRPVSSASGLAGSGGTAGPGHTRSASGGAAAMRQQAGATAQQPSQQPQPRPHSQPGTQPQAQGQQPWATQQYHTPAPAHQQQPILAQQQQQQLFAMAQGNPVYDSPDVSMSPLTLAKREAYTPATAHDMTAIRFGQPTAQQRAPGAGAGVAGSRGPAGAAAGAGPGETYGHPSPAVAKPGDLFNPHAVATAVTRRPTELQYLCELPAWTYQRPSLTGLDLITAAASTSSSVPGSGTVPDPTDVTPQELMVSERAIVSDLLHAFLGVSSKLVRPQLVPPVGAASAAATGPCLTFTVREDLVHETLRERVMPLLPICDYVAALQRFIETRSAHCYGRVTHALAAALRGYLEDWQVMVSMMENQMLRGALDLTRLTFYCQQPAAALAVLADVAADAANGDRSSRSLLDMLYKRYNSCAGNGPGRSLLHHLLTAAAAPYCACLERWLRQGVLDDPYHEFMIQEDQALRRDSPAAMASGAAGAASRSSAYWRGRYTLRFVPQLSMGGATSDQSEPRGLATPGPGGGAAASGAAGPPMASDVPVFLMPYRELILRTGKYQNVLRECGQPVAQPVMPQSAAAAAAGAPAAPLPPLSYDPTQPANLQQHIRAAHAAASSALLGFLLRGGGGGASVRGGVAGLVAVLRSMKHFFLLDQGDLLVSIMEVADEELCKPAKAINRTRLQSLLEMAVKMSSVAADPHADSLSFEMDPRSLETLAKAAAALAAALAAPGADKSRVGAYAGAGDSPYGTPTQHGGAAAWGPGATGGRGPLPMQRTPGGSRLLGPRDQDLPGWELFLPTLKLDWPATLVVGAEELMQYQLLFKHLWGLKRAERQLEATWLLLQGTKQLPRAGKSLQPQAAARRHRQLAVAHALCHRLQFTIQELLRYGTLDVLAPLWNCLEEGVQHRAADVDQVIEMHRDFLRRAAAGLMLDQPRALRAMVTLQQSAAGFARHVSVLWDRLEAGIETASRGTQVAPADIVGEQQRAAQLTAALDDLQRLMGEATAQVQALVAAIRDHYEGLMTGGAAGAMPPGGAPLGGVGAGADAAEAGGWDLETLQNLAVRLDWDRPASGTLGAVLAEMAGRQ